MIQVRSIHFTLLKRSDAQGFKVHHYMNEPHTLVGNRITRGLTRFLSSTLRVSDLVILELDLSIFISKFPSDPDAAGPRATLGETHTTLSHLWELCLS